MIRRLFKTGEGLRTVMDSRMSVSPLDSTPGPASGPRPRDADRFSLDDFEVTLHRDRRPGLFRKPENLALNLLDLSRTGAQVVCTKPLEPGEKVRLTVHLKKFRDTFEVEAETKWSRFPRPQEGLAWRAGLAFGALDGPRKRLLESMESWFTYVRPENDSSNVE